MKTAPDFWGFEGMDPSQEMVMASATLLLAETICATILDYTLYRPSSTLGEALRTAARLPPAFPGVATVSEERHDRFSWKRSPVLSGQRFNLRLNGPADKATVHIQEDRWPLTIKQRSALTVNRPLRICKCRAVRARSPAAPSRLSTTQSPRSSCPPPARPSFPDSALRKPCPWS